MNWTKQIVMVGGFPVKIYANLHNSSCAIFPLFGRYYVVRSDINALDLATSIVVGRGNELVTYEAYKSSLEDTAIIQLDKVA